MVCVCEACICGNHHCAEHANSPTIVANHPPLYETTGREDFKAAPEGYKRQESFKPKSERHSVDAPFEGASTNSISYGAKPLPKRVPAKPMPDNTRPSSDKFSGYSTKQHDFVMHPLSKRSPIQPKSDSGAMAPESGSTDYK